jgi:choice-of-anchor C domain-containing protein
MATHREALARLILKQWWVCPMKFSQFAGVSFAAAMLASSAQAAGLLDGDFSTPSGGASFATYNFGSSMGPWTVTQGSVDLIGGYWQSPTVGGGSVDLDGNFQAGGISQSFSIGPGTYKLSFYLSGNPDSALGVKSVQVAVGDALQTFTYDTSTAGNSHGSMLYALQTLNFSTLGATTLSFTSLDASNSAFGPVIGGVSISAVPEPTTWALMLMGFGAVGYAVRRQRAAVAAV